MLKLKWSNSKKTRGNLPVSEKKTSKVNPSDKCLLAVLFNVIVCGIVVAHSGTVYASDPAPLNGYAASAQDELIASCYAQYAYNAYLTNPAFKHMGDCDRRFSPNKQIPFDYLGSQDVSDNYDAKKGYHYKDTSMDWYTRVKPAGNGHRAKKQLLIAFRGTKQIRDYFTDIRAEGAFWRMWNAQDANFLQLATEYRDQYFNLGVTGVFHDAFYDKEGGKLNKKDPTYTKDDGIDNNQWPIEDTHYRQHQPRFPKGFWQRALANSSRVIEIVTELQNWQHANDGDIEVIVTGHSLGAATSTITGLWLMDRFESCKENRSNGVTSNCKGADKGEQKVEVFAYNPPKTGNRRMQELTHFIMNHYDDRYRMHLFINSIDFVSRVPGNPKYKLSVYTAYLDLVEDEFGLIARVYHLVEPAWHVLDPTLTKGLATTVVGFQNAYAPVFVGKAPVNVSDGQKRWSNMEHHYKKHHTYDNFPSFNLGDALRIPLPAHSPQQWIISGWNDYSVPN